MYRHFLPVKQFGRVTPTVTLRMGLTKGSRRPAAVTFFAGAAPFAVAVPLAGLATTLGWGFLTTAVLAGTLFLVVAGLDTATAGFVFGVNGPAFEAALFWPPADFDAGVTTTTGVFWDVPDLAGAAEFLLAEPELPGFCAGITAMTGVFGAPVEGFAPVEACAVAGFCVAGVPALVPVFV